MSFHKVKEKSRSKIGKGKQKGNEHAHPVKRVHAYIALAASSVVFTTVPSRNQEAKSRR